jgi:tetraacyldisaccharide 4'-kinase
VRTIGIGNVQAGGTGKTPLTLRIAEEAIARGLRVAVLTRGYRSEWERSGGLLVPGGPVIDPRLCGDEAALMHERLPNLWIGVGADRIAQFAQLQAESKRRQERPFDLVLIDDAFQHWKIDCDLSVVAVTDAVFGERYFRERYAAISPRDLVVLTKGTQFPLALTHHPRRVRTRFRIEGADPDARYHFVAALGDPDRARATLLEEGFKIEETAVFPDHHAFDSLEKERILAQARAGGRRVLLTGKDAVKWRALGAMDSDIQVVEPTIDILEGESEWRKALWNDPRS